MWQLGEPGGNAVLGSQQIGWFRENAAYAHSPLPVLVMGRSDSLQNYCASSLEDLQ